MSLFDFLLSDFDPYGRDNLVADPKITTQKLKVYHFKKNYVY